jgi:hypothetical protein
MKILWARLPPALENLRRHAEVYGPEHGLHRRLSRPGKGPMENGAMLDILMLAIGLGGFALLALYGLAGERL